MKKALWIVIALLFMGLCAEDADAAPRRKYRGVARDQYGNTLSSATVNVKVQATDTNATIYSSATDTSAETGSNVTTSSTGVFEFWCDSFDYDLGSLFKLTITKTGYTSQTVTNLAVDDIYIGAYTLAADTTISTPTEWYVPPGVTIDLNGYILTVNVPIRAGLYQIFSNYVAGDLSTLPSVMFCPQTVDMSGGSGINNADAITCSGTVTEVYPQWWGANPSNSASDATLTKNAINAAVRSLNPNRAYSGGNMVIGPGGVVKISGFFQVNGTIALTSGVSLEGLGTSNNWNTFTSSMGEQSAIYCAQTDGTDCITSHVDSGMFDASCEITGYSESQFNVSRPKGTTIRGLRITGNTSSGWGVVLGEPTKSTETYQSYCAGTSYPWRFTGAYDATIEENIIDSHGKGGMHLNCTAGSRIRKNWITGNKSHGIISVWDNAAQVFTENHFQNNCGTTSVSCTVVGVANDPCYNGIKLIYGYGNDITGNSFESTGAGGHGCQQGQTYIAASMGLSYSGNYHEHSGATTYLDGTAALATDAVTDTAHGLITGERVVFSTVVSGITAGTHYYVLGSISGATAQNTGDTVTYSSHGLADGETIQFTVAPTGLSIGTTYYVISSAANTFQVSLTAGGSPVPITADGSGIAFKRLDSFQVSTTSGGSALDITADGAVTYRRSETQRGVHLALWNHGINVRDNFFAHNNKASSLYCDAVYIVPDYASSTEYQIADVIISGNTATTNSTAEYNYCNPHLVNFSGRYPYARNITLENNGVRVNTPGLTGHAYYNDPDTIYTNLSYASNVKVTGSTPVSDSAILQANKTRLIDTLLNGGVFASSSNIKGMWFMDETGATDTIKDRSGNSHDMSITANAGGAAVNANTMYPSTAGTIPALLINGQGVAAADSDDFTFSLSSTPFSIIVLAKPKDLPPTYAGVAPYTNTLFAKYDGTTGSEQREYLFYVYTDGSTNKLTWAQYDNSGGSAARYYNTSIRSDVNEWHTYAVTHAGSAGDVATTVNLYYDGSDVDDAGSGTITSMANTTSVPGNSWTATDGSVYSFYGDYALAIVVAEELSASQVARIDALLRGAAGDGLSTYVTPTSSGFVTKDDPTTTGTWTHTGGTLDAGAKALDMTYTLDSSAGAENIGSLIAVTSAGTESQTQTPLKMTITGGYTGSSSFRAFRIENLSASSGNAIASTGMIGNVAGNFLSTGVGALNVGNNGVAANGTAINIGVLGCGGDTEASQTNYGVYGISKSTNTGGIAYGVYGTLDATSTSGAAVGANNGTTTNDIIQAQDNGVVAWAVKDGGETRITSTTSGVGGGLGTKTAYGTANITASASIAITLSIPSGALLRGCSARVSTALAAGENWDLAFSGGSTTALCTNKDDAKQTKCDTLIVPEVASNTTNLAITKNGGGSFTAQGVIDAVCYYDVLTSMSDAP